MRIALRCKCSKLPLSRAMFSVSLLKEAIGNVDKDYLEILYKYDNDKKNKKIKDLNTSIYLGNFRIEGEDIVLLDNYFILNISFFNNELLYYLYNGILKMTHFKYKQYEIENIKTVLLKEKKITMDIALFKTLSPIAVKDKNNKYLFYTDKNFENELNFIANMILENVRGYGLKKELEFYPQHMKTIVFKEQITGFNGDYYVNANKGSFVLRGDVEDLNSLYKTGLGYRRSQGYSMIDLVE